MNKLSLCCIVFSFVLLISCQRDEEITDVPVPEPVPELPKEGISIKTNVFGRIVDENDEPIAGVLVQGGSLSTNTDINGIYILNEVMLDQARAYITATKTGYFKGSRVFRPLKDGMSQPTLIKMLAHKSIGTVNASAGGSVQSAGGIKVDIPANSIEGYSGTVEVMAAFVNPTSPDFFARMAGDLAADNSSGKRGSLVSYGMTKIDLLDDNGNRLQVKSGMQVTVSSPVPQSLQSSATPTIDMWYFDETKGIWVPDGTATYANGFYTGKVSHFSDRNWDHWNSNMVVNLIIKYILPKYYNGQTLEEIEKTFNPQPELVVQIRDKATKNTLFTTHLPPLTPNTTEPRGGNLNTTFAIPSLTSEMEVTVMPVQPGGPDYPTNENYTPTADEVQPQAPTFASEDESVTVDYMPTTPPTPLEITFPPSQGGGTGETIVNVNGKAINCDNLPVKSGYAFLSIRSGNTIVKNTTAPIYGAEGRFTVQYFFSSALPKKVDNVVLTVYDYETGKKSQDIKINVNPSVAYMIPEPVKICDDSGNNSGGKVFNGNYLITNDDQLKAFIDSAYTEVTGMLTIKGSVTDLGGIIDLKKVGSLEIYQTAITSLGGLAELEEINGSLGLYYNNQLVTANFPKLTSKHLDGGLYLTGNQSLVGLTLPSVETIANNSFSYITIGDHPLLKTLSIPKLKSVTLCDHIEISGTALENLNTFSNASGTLGPWGMRIHDNDDLISVSGLKNIKIQGRLEISGNAILPNLDGINILDAIGDYVNLSDNTLLADITSVSNKLKSTAGLTISKNESLIKVDFPLLEINQGIGIEYNNELTEISFPILKETNSLSITNLPKLSSINLNALEVINGRLYFNLSGGVNSVPALAVFDLPQLKTCQIFELLNCPSITNLDGFNNLTSVSPGYFTISSGNITGTDVKLKTINGFNKLTTVKEGLSLSGAAGFSNSGELTTIHGFKQLTSVGELTINGKNLTDISGFKNLTTIARSLYVNNTALSGFGGLEKVENIGEQLIINDNPLLSSLTGLQALSTLSTIHFYANPKLLSLNGLEKITSVKNGIQLTNNESLANLDGLQNVTGKVNGVTISSNLALLSFCGLTRLINEGDPGYYNVNNNGYNPTVQDIKDGNCSTGFK